MKTFLKTKTLIAGLLVTVGLTSCIKNNDTNTPIYVSGVSLVHASPTTEKLDVYINETKASGQNFDFGTKIDYLNAYSGNRTISVTKKDSGAKLTSDLVKLAPQLGYTVFVIDQLEKVALLTLEDNLAKPDAGKAKIRFVNLNPEGGAFNLAVAGLTTDLSTNKSFKEYSDFETITPGDKVTFNVKNAASGTVETSLEDVKIEAGKIYTLYARGLKANNDETKFGAAIFTHK